MAEKTTNTENGNGLHKILPNRDPEKYDNNGKKAFISTPKKKSNTVLVIVAIVALLAGVGLALAL